MLSRITAALACLIAICAGVALCAPPATAQTSLGIVSTPVQLTACPALPQNTSFDASLRRFVVTS
jgi:hypothetical protein